MSKEASFVLISQTFKRTTLTALYFTVFSIHLRRLISWIINLSPYVYDFPNEHTMERKMFVIALTVSGAVVPMIFRITFDGWMINC